MPRKVQNMQDIQNSVEIKSVQWKLEKRVLQPIGHVKRLNDDRPVMRAIQGWLPALETIDKKLNNAGNHPNTGVALVSKRELTERTSTA